MSGAAVYSLKGTSYSFSFLFRLTEMCYNIHVRRFLSEQKISASYGCKTQLIE